MRRLASLSILVYLLLPLCLQAAPTVLITNVDLFDSRAGKLQKQVSVVVSDNRVSEVTEKRPEGSFDRIIDGRGNVLLPGLIDTHVHLAIPAAIDESMELPWDYLSHLMAQRSREMLMRGFTSVRDLGGPVFGLRRAIEEGIVDGPRIFPSGAFITQTSGHGDFRNPVDSHPEWGGASTNAQRLGFYRLADGIPQVLASTRENLGKGATQIKIMGSGGVGSMFDPVDSVQYTPEELRAIVQAAADWDTYAAAHLHNAAAIRRAVEAGVMSVDHGFMMDEEGARLMAQKGAFLSTQFAILEIVFQMDFLTEWQLQKAQTVVDASHDMVRYVKKYGIKTTFSSDSFGPESLAAPLQTREFEARAKFFTPAETLQHATANAAELLELSGKRNPYPGKLGVIEEGAMADMIIVRGNPLDDISLMGDPEANLLLIMKGGKIYKKVLPENPAPDE
jgi:imidazolonepropionase-like amidohydrolase